MVSANLIHNEFNLDFLLLQVILSLRVQGSTSYMFPVMYSIVSPMARSPAFPVRDVLISDTSIASECVFKTRYSVSFSFF